MKQPTGVLLINNASNCRQRSALWCQSRTRINPDHLFSMFFF